MATMRELCAEHTVCAILRNVPDEKALSYAKACVDGGVKMFEIAMNTPHATQQIQQISAYFGKEVLVGAGTVITPQRCEAAQQAGANFFLTPSTSLCTLAFCRDKGIPLLPGVMTPTDVAVCLEYGFDLLKLFPASDLPDTFIKSLKGPFDETDYVAVGGVSPKNIRNFFERGFVGVGIGSNLFPKEYAANGQWDKAAQSVADMMQSIQDLL